MEPQPSVPTAKDFPYAHVDVLGFDPNPNTITTSSGVNVLLTNDTTTLKSTGTVQFYWLNGATASSLSFTKTTRLGSVQTLAKFVGVPVITVPVPADLLTETQEAGGMGGVYYAYLDGDLSDPISVGRPTGPTDSTALKRHAVFSVDVKPLSLVLPAPTTKSPIVQADLTPPGLDVKVSYAGMAVGQSVTLHWKQGQTDIVVATLQVQQVQPMDFYVTSAKVPNPQEGLIELYYVVTEDNKPEVSQIAHVVFGQKIDDKLPAPTFADAPAGYLDLASVINVVVQIPSSAQAAAATVLTIEVRELDAKGVLLDTKTKKVNAPFTLPSAVTFPATAFKSSGKRLEARYWIGDDSTHSSDVANISLGKAPQPSKESGVLWAAGYTGFHNLGRGFASGVTSQPILTLQKDQLTVKFLPHGSGSRTHSAIDAKGEIWSWGLNQDGQAGVGTTESCDRTQASGYSDEKFVFVSNGAHHTLALDTAGSLWVAGATSLYRTGAPLIPPTLSVFTKVLDGYTFSFVSAGSGRYEDGEDSICSMGIDKKQQLLGWGTSDQYLLGEPAKSTQHPVVIDSTHKWTWVSHHYYAAAAITTDGRLFTWGTRVAILGRSLSEFFTAVPTEVPVQDGSLKVVFTKVLVSDYHMLALDTKGQVWGWGYNYASSLTNVVTVNGWTKPVKITSLGEGCTDIAATFRGGAAIVKDGSVSTWGFDYSGELAQGTIGTEHSAPATVASGPKWSDVKATRISFGWESLFVLITKRDV